MSNDNGNSPHQPTDQALQAAVFIAGCLAAEGLLELRARPRLLEADQRTDFDSFQEAARIIAAALDALHLVNTEQPLTLPFDW
jgi:hypothetical protein